MFLATILSLFISWKVLFKFVRPRFKYNLKTIKYYLFQGAPLGIAAFAALIYTHVDVLILSSYLGDRAVGIYSAATPFVFALIQLLNVPFVVAIFPALSRLHKEDKVRFKRGFLKGMIFIALWSIPSAILISLLSPVVIPILFGQKYIQAIGILQILIYSVPFMAFSALLYKGLIVLGRQKDYLFISVLGALINILLNIVLIPQLGIFGAVWAMIITQAFLFFVYCTDLYLRFRQTK